MIIRINLHPARKPKAKSNPSKGILVVCIIILCIVIIGAFLAADRVNKQKVQANVEAKHLQEEIDATNERMKDSKSIEATIASLKELQALLGRLASIRQGPQYVLNELSRLLSNPRDVIARKEATEQGWLLAWEPENVTLTSFRDMGSGVVEIRGEARNMEDIEEFWTRLKTSSLFRNIHPGEFKDNKNSLTGEVVHTFIFNMDANFNYRTADGRALVDLLTQSPDEANTETNGSEQSEEAAKP